MCEVHRADIYKTLCTPLSKVRGAPRWYLQNSESLKNFCGGPPYLILPNRKKDVKKYWKFVYIPVGTESLAHHRFPRSSQFPNGFPRRYSTTNFTKICRGIWKLRAEVHLRLSEKCDWHRTNFDVLCVRHFQTAFHENPTNSFVAHCMFHMDRRTWCRHKTFCSSSQMPPWKCQFVVWRQTRLFGWCKGRTRQWPLVRYCVPVTTPALATTTKGVATPTDVEPWTFWIGRKVVPTRTGHSTQHNTSGAFV